MLTLVSSGCVRSNAAYAFLLDDKVLSRVEARGEVELSGPDDFVTSAVKPLPRKLGNFGHGSLAA